MKTKYYLIQLSIWSHPHWFMREKRRGKEWYINGDGGGFPAENIKVLETAEVEDELDLDWSKSRYFNYELDYANGWLSPTGQWTQCQYHDHIDVAYYVLKSTEGELENKSYIKISGSTVYNTETGRYTRKQIEWLVNHGYSTYANMFEELYTVIEN